MQRFREKNSPGRTFLRKIFTVNGAWKIMSYIKTMVERSEVWVVEYALASSSLYIGFGSWKNSEFFSYIETVRLGKMSRSFSYIAALFRALTSINRSTWNLLVILSRGMSGFNKDFIIGIFGRLFGMRKKSWVGRNSACRSWSSFSPKKTTAE